MKYVKNFGLLAVAAAALMAFAGSASATSVTTTTGGAASTPTIHLVTEGGHISILNTISFIQCDLTLEGSVVSHGAGKPTVISASKVSFTGCTNNWHVTVTKPGNVSLSYTVGHNAQLVWDGLQLTATRLGITCNYETKNTAIGTLTGGSPATADIEASIPIAAGSSGLCGSGNTKTTGSLISTSALFVAP